MKKLLLAEKCALAAFLFLFLYSVLTYQSACAQIRENVVRMHVIANSDEETDQHLKLLVRDEMLREGEALLSGTQDKAEALEALSAQLALLEERARGTLLRNGCTDAVSVTLEKTYFPTRSYGEITLPAGKYDALRVVIGAGEGENFWCVLFPSLCVGASIAGEELFPVIGENGTRLVSSAQEYRIEWKTMELFEKIRSFFDRRKDG